MRFNFVTKFYVRYRSEEISPLCHSLWLLAQSKAEMLGNWKLRSHLRIKRAGLCAVVGAQGGWQLLIRYGGGETVKQDCTLIDGKLASLQSNVKFAVRCHLSKHSWVDRLDGVVATDEKYSISLVNTFVAENLLCLSPNLYLIPAGMHAPNRNHWQRIE